ncbi:hypothetical protein [Flavobacterium pectinovorum]|uniref:hypothetical protein n=1 Tax=Flavobacterium pectinovorum TaxID=29533 RepID=UPI001FADED71|nr:hypothetical protein [Flavobacterium pectinovorum]MCI9845827.1 hypothetical protein [Flavobacterium pectinovorum]
MRKITLLVSILFLAFSCGVKTTQSLISDGNYDAAINRAVEALRTNKDSKGKQDYVYLLEEAFAKAKERDLHDIEMMVKESNPVNFERIYNTYLNLEDRQAKIRPLLPLRLLKQGKNATFVFDNYTDRIIESKIALSKYLYNNAAVLLKSKVKQDYRKAYDDLGYLEKINPGYKNVKKLMEEAQFKGTDFVNVYTQNQTNLVIPKRLQDDLLDFSTYGLNDKWTVYHTVKQKNTSYDYSLIVNFREIIISPEQIKEKEFIKEKQVKDGVKTLLDSRGNPVKDSLGRPIKVDKFKNIRINIFEYKQFKSCQITAKIDYVNAKDNQLIQSFPLASEFVFESLYSTYKGDRNACDESYLPNFNKRLVPFPNNEQMIYDTGEDLKVKLKNIIVQNRFKS